MANNYKKEIFYTDPIKFAEEFLDIKLYWWQKILLRRYTKYNAKFLL